MAFTRVSEIKPWLVDFLLDDNPRTTGKKLHVLKYVSGPHEDGSIVKAATDLDVSIYVRFTAHALAVFTNTVDSESPDTHEEFNRAFIILKKYWSAHCPQSDQGSSHFEVVIDDFSLWMNETGLRIKVEPMPCMAVEEVRAKSNRLWTEWKSRQSSRRDSATDEDETVTSQNGGEPSMSSIPLSQLQDLDQMGMSSSTVADQDKENVRGGAFTGKQRLSRLGPSDLPVQLPDDVDPSLIHISQDQQNQLNNITEWKSGYRPPAVSYVSSSPSTENSAAKSSPARQSSQADSSLSRPPLPDRPWRRTVTDNSFRVLGTLTTMEPIDDRVATSDMATGTYGIDVAIQVGDSMLGKSSTGVTLHTEIAAQVGDSLLNPHVSESQSQYVSESQCDFQSQCAFDDVTKVSYNSGDAESLSTSSLDSVIEVDDPCNVIQSQSTHMDRMNDGSCNDQITDTQGQRVVSSREESSETPDSTGRKLKKSDSSTSRKKDISCNTNSDDDSFVTEDSLDKNGLAADVGDYIPRVRLSCSESPETVQSFRKSLRRSASTSNMGKERNRKESESIDDNSDKSLKLGQVQRLRSVDSSDGDHRRSPRLQQVAAPELGQVQRLRSEESSDSDHRKSPRLQQVAAPELGQVQRLRSEESSDSDHRKSPRLQQVAAPGKESPLARSRKVAVLRDVSMQRSSPRNRQDTEENFAESEDIIMPTPPKVSRRKGYSPLRPISTRSNQKNASPLVDLKGTCSSLKTPGKTPVTFEGEVTVHRHDTPRNLDKQLQAVDTSASAKAAASPGRVNQRGTEVSVSKHQEVAVETPSTGEEISPARPDHISPRTPSDDIAIINETEVAKTPSLNTDIISPSPRSTRRSVTQGPYHSTQISPEASRELPPPKLTLSPIKTQDRCRIDIRRKRESQGRRDARGSTSRSAGDTSPATDSTSSEGSGTDESTRPSSKSETADNEKTTKVSPLPRTTDSSRRSNRSSGEETSPAPPEKSSVIYQAPTNTAEMLPWVAVERLELSKYKSTSSGSVIIDDADPVHQTEAPQKESQAITPVHNVGMHHKTKSQELVNDISEDSAKRSTRRTVSDKTEVIEDIKEPTTSPHLSVTTCHVLGRTRRNEPQAPVNKDDSKESNKSPHLSVTHGHKIARPRRSTSQQDSPVFVSRKERLNVTRQSPRPTQVFKDSSSPSGSSSPNSENDARTPARIRSQPPPRTPHTPQTRHTRNNSSNSSVSVDQFYRGSEDSPRWRSPRVHICLSIQTEDIHGRDKSQKSGTPTGKSPDSKTPGSCKHKAHTERPVSHTRQGRFNVTRKSPRQSQVPEHSSSPTTSGEDEQADAPRAKTSTRASKTAQKGLEAEDTSSTCSASVSTSTHSKVGSRHIMKVPYQQSDDEASIVEIDDDAKTQSDDEDYEPRLSHIKKKLQEATCERRPSSRRGSLQKSGTQPHTPNHRSERDGRLQKTTPRRTPRAFKTTQKGVPGGDTCSSTSSESVTEVHRKVLQRHTRKNVIPTSEKVPGESLDDEASADSLSIEEIDDGTKTQSDEEDDEPWSSHIKKKVQNTTYGRPPSSRRGSLRKSGTQPHTPNHQAENVGRLQKTTPRRTPQIHKTPQKELQSEEDRPTMHMRVCVQRMEPRLWLHQSDDESSVEEIDDDAKTQSDEDCVSGSSGNKSKLENRTPLSKRRKLRKNESEVDSPSEKQSQKPTPRCNKASRKELPSEDMCSASSQSVTSSPLQKDRPNHTTKPTPSKSSQAAVKLSGEEEVDEEEEDYVPESNVKGKKADSDKAGSTSRKRLHHQPSPQKNLGKSKKSAKSQKMEETEEDSEDEKASDDDDFRPSPRKKIKAHPRQRPTVRQKRPKAMKESSDEESEDEADEKDEDYNPSDHEKDEDYNPSPGTKLRLPLDRKSTRRYQDRTKLSLAKKPATQSRKTKAKNRMNVQLAETGRIEIIREKTFRHNLSAIFSEKKPASTKLKASNTHKRKLLSQQTQLGELLPEVQEKPAKGSNLRLKMASPLKPLLPKLSGKRQVYDISDIVAQASDNSSSSIGNSPPHKSSEEQEKGTIENINSSPIDVVEEEDEALSMPTPVSSLPSHQPVTKDSSPEQSLDGSVEKQKEDIATAPDQETTTAAEEQGNLDDLESNPVAPTKASSSPGTRRFSVSTPASSLPSHQPEQREEPASLKDTPVRGEIQLILSALPKDLPVGASSPLTDMDMPRDLITKLSGYFADDEFQ